MNIKVKKQKVGAKHALNGYSIKLIPLDFWDFKNVRRSFLCDFLFKNALVSGCEQ